VRHQDVPNREGLRQLLVSIQRGRISLATNPASPFTSEITFNLIVPRQFETGETNCLDIELSIAYSRSRKEASGLRLLLRVLYTQGVRGSSPLPPTIVDNRGEPRKSPEMPYLLKAGECNQVRPQSQRLLLL